MAEVSRLVATLCRGDVLLVWGMARLLGVLTAPLFSPPADDAAAHVLRSVGQNSAMRSSSRPFTFISLLLPLLVPQGL